MKNCSKCKVEKPTSEFSKHKSQKSGLSSQCKECVKEYKNSNLDSIRDYQKRYKKDNYNKLRSNGRDYERTCRANDPLVILKGNVRGRIYKAFKGSGYKKNSKTEEVLGCSFEFLREHLEGQFEPWMTWDNKGNPKDGILEPNKSWDIDHIIPLAAAETEEDILNLNHYSNLQPLCSYNNRFIKRDKY